MAERKVTRAAPRQQYAAQDEANKRQIADAGRSQMAEAQQSNPVQREEENKAKQLAEREQKVSATKDANDARTLLQERDEAPVGAARAQKEEALVSASDRLQQNPPPKPEEKADAPTPTILREAFPADRRGAATANDQGTEAMGTFAEDGSFSQAPVPVGEQTNPKAMALIEQAGGDLQKAVEQRPQHEGPVGWSLESEHFNRTLTVLKEVGAIEEPPDGNIAPAVEKVDDTVLRLAKKVAMASFAIGKSTRELGIPYTLTANDVRQTKGMVTIPETFLDNEARFPLQTDTTASMSHVWDPRDRLGR